MTETRQTKTTGIAPWARALIVALVLAFIAVVMLVAGASAGAAIFGFGALAVAVVGGIIGLAGVTNRGA